jgi:hypothetical protein
MTGSPWVASRLGRLNGVPAEAGHSADMEREFASSMNNVRIIQHSRFSIQRGGVLKLLKNQDNFTSPTKTRSLCMAGLRLA